MANACLCARSLACVLVGECGCRLGCRRCGRLAPDTCVYVRALARVCGAGWDDAAEELGVGELAAFRQQAARMGLMDENVCMRVAVCMSRRACVYGRAACRHAVAIMLVLAQPSAPVAPPQGNFVDAAATAATRLSVAGSAGAAHSGADAEEQVCPCGCVAARHKHTRTRPLACFPSLASCVRPPPCLAPVPCVRNTASEGSPNMSMTRLLSMLLLLLALLRVFRGILTAWLLRGCRRGRPAAGRTAQRAAWTPSGSPRWAR
jgi:hypothetical protein